MMTTKIVLLSEELDTVRDDRSSLGRESYLVYHSTLDQDAIRQVLIEDPDAMIVEVDPEEEARQFCGEVLISLDLPVPVTAIGQRS